MDKIFMVEDDKKLASIIKDELQKYEYSVLTVKDFSEVLSEFMQIKPDLVLLDINLPYFDGFQLCRLMRKKSNVPIIIISARNQDVEQVMGIELGADDYLVKPFNLSILLAKVKAHLRRYSEYTTSNSLESNGLILDEKTFKMTYQKNQVDLTKNEFLLMKCFMENKNTYVKRDRLLELLWDDTMFIDENTLTVNVTRVKQKLRQIGLSDVIKTKRSVGYLFSFGEF